MAGEAYNKNPLFGLVDNFTSLTTLEIDFDIQMLLTKDDDKFHGTSQL